MHIRTYKEEIIRKLFLKNFMIFSRLLYSLSSGKMNSFVLAFNIFIVMALIVIQMRIARPSKNILDIYKFCISFQV